MLNHKMKKKHEKPKTDNSISWNSVLNGRDGVTFSPNRPYPPPSPPPPPNHPSPSLPQPATPTAQRATVTTKTGDTTHSSTPYVHTSILGTLIYISSRS